MTVQRFLQGSSTAEEHGCYVWENFVKPCPIKHVCIMAHSYGGAVLLEMVFLFRLKRRTSFSMIDSVFHLQASKFKNDFQERVFAVALTDSPISIYGHNIKKNVLKMLKKV